MLVIGWRMARFHSMVSTCFRKGISACLVYFFLLAGVDAQNRSKEGQVLLTFRDANWHRSKGYWITWNESAENPCAWFGVTCTNNQTVWQLDLSRWGVSIESVKVLAHLPDLRQLDLSSNGMLHIPDGIGTLTQLTRLDLSQNQFLDSIPADISLCRSLRVLSFQQSGVSGEIPSLRNLLNLQSVFLGGNFLGGSFPIELGELRLLTEVDLSNNGFDGTIPTLPNLSNLVQLKLDHNLFTGFEDPWILGPNSSLQYLSASFNVLESMIPSSITSLVNLEVLNLSCNRLSGQIPVGFSQLYRNDFVLDLSQNLLNGTIPSDMLQQNSAQSARTCASINVSFNLLVGNIPIDGASYFCFNSLDLSHNNLSGSIPMNLFSTADNSIESLWLQYNSLSGDIVEVMLEGLHSEGGLLVSELRLQNNLFTGDLSRIGVNGSTNYALEILDLGENNLEWRTSKAIPDPIRATLELLTSNPFFIEFRVGGNNFAGTSLPTACFVNASTDWTPQLEVLNLSNSHLEGEISGEAFNVDCIPELNVLDLSGNNISGRFPENVTSLNWLISFNVSNNNLSGPLPYIPTNSSLFNPSSFDGNSGLCGYLLNRSCPHPSPTSSGGVPWWLVLIIIGGSMTVAVGSFLTTCWRWREYRKRHQQDEDLIKTLMERDAATLMSLRELKKATDNFAESAQIGSGGFGTVYRGKLNDGTVAAIKKSKREGTDKEKEQFLNEVRILSQVNHRNLVKLLGCCLENKIALLVFEFVSNGTLQEHLQGKIGAVRLTWEQRLKIAIQTADALNYLHSAAKSPIYHRDVKSANILLDDYFNAQVADFGISKLAPLDVTHVSTLAVCGTIGYLDPEYYTTYRLTDKSDVYGFGVVLLELISAKPAIGIDVDGENAGLVNFASPYIQEGDLGSLIDPAIVETYNDDRGKASITNVGRLAMKCLDLRSKARPSMREVLTELQNLWPELSGTFLHMDSFTGDETGDENKDAEHDRMFLLSESLSIDISNSTGDSSGLQMSEIVPDQDP